MSSSKNELRNKVLQQRAATAPTLLSAWSDSINQQLIARLKSHSVKTLHCFLPLDREVGVWETVHYALQNDITVVVPKTLPKGKLLHLILDDANNLTEGLFKTQLPATEIESQGTYDVIIVPGLVFDHEGGRIGYGAGYYDRLLADHERAHKIGVCFPFQLSTHAIPQEDHDVAIDEVITG